MIWYQLSIIRFLEWFLIWNGESIRKESGRGIDGETKKLTCIAHVLYPSCCWTFVLHGWPIVPACCCCCPCCVCWIPHDSIRRKPKWPLLWAWDARGRPHMPVGESTARLLHAVRGRLHRQLLRVCACRLPLAPTYTWACVLAFRW